MNKLLLVIFLFAGISLESCGQKASDKVENISAEKMDELIKSEGGIILDVRTAQEIEKGFIQNAVFQDILEDDFHEKVLKLPKDQTIYVYCWKGGRSAEAADYLTKNGYTNIYNLKGGIDAWKAANKPIVKN